MTPSILGLHSAMRNCKERKRKWEETISWKNRAKNGRESKENEKQIETQRIREGERNNPMKK